MQVILLTDCRIKLEKVIAILLENGFKIAGVCFGDCKVLGTQKVLCEKYNLRILERRELFFCCSSVDVIFSYGYTYYIPKEVFSSVQYCINFHPGLLPNYKGCYTLYYGMMRNEKEWGVSAHFVNEKFDEGEIILIEKFALDYEKTGKEIAQYTWEEVGIRAFRKVVSLIKSNALTEISQKASIAHVRGGGGVL
ncbi:formyltransferase family protein [Helicobacter turcicus]|uniref:Formyl transferase N-terminal domain-containing protein n=1 Tax=Helicobacter turcicus TaxID=2867412 RepID=A0ABS7JQ04_9HELI|nr:formyltransferase family protein [Helicobacter turcicus]MBX7491484.1 hypothetical protein [Helicobacter turcicus]